MEWIKSIILILWELCLGFVALFACLFSVMNFILLLYSFICHVFVLFFCTVFINRLMSHNTPKWNPCCLVMCIFILCLGNLFRLCLFLSFLLACPFSPTLFASSLPVRPVSSLSLIVYTHMHQTLLITCLTLNVARAGTHANTHKVISFKCLKDVHRQG